MSRCRGQTIYVLLLGTQDNVALTDPAFRGHPQFVYFGAPRPLRLRFRRSPPFPAVPIEFQVYRGNWQQQPSDTAPIHESDGSITTVDTILLSPDSSVSLRTETASGGPNGQYVAANLPAEAAAFQKGYRGRCCSKTARAGVVDIGSPRSVTVTNAEAAMEDALTYPAADGQHVMTARLAVQNQHMYFLVLNAPADFSSNDPAATAILSSFALAPSAAPSTFQTVADPSGIVQFQAPQDWQPQAVDATPVQLSQGPEVSVEKVLSAPDGIGYAKLTRPSAAAPLDLYSADQLPEFPPGVSERVRRKAIF